MAEHRAPRRRGRSTLLRGLLGLGVVGVLAVGGTQAAWTDSVSIGGGTVTGGTLDLKVNNADSVVTTTLSMAAMVPGSTSAEVLTVKNAGTAPLRYNLTGGLTGTDAATYASSSALRISVVKDGTRSVGGGNATCTGGTTLVSGAALGSTTTSELLALRGPVPAAGTETLCVQVGLDASAPSALQGRTATLALTATATSDLG